jgi:hypothetical protein
MFFLDGDEIAEEFRMNKSGPEADLETALRR